jgi:hypothetical protein
MLAFLSAMLLPLVICAHAHILGPILTYSLLLALEKQQKARRRLIPK